MSGPKSPGLKVVVPLSSRERLRTILITSRSFKESANHREGSQCFGSTNYFNERFPNALHMKNILALHIIICGLT